MPEIVTPPAEVTPPETPEPSTLEESSLPEETAAIQLESTQDLPELNAEESSPSVDASPALNSPSEPTT
ncbi:MAG: hypothetical protein HC890_10060 [Chloroflexaceae bacterium]|nr:hypothetical protein [Chloroflexaceae bacterium]